jgi:hypothetical protein
MGIFHLMKASTRGLLLSGLVYPGAGQLALGHKASGIGFILGTTAGLIALVYQLMRRLFQVVDQAWPELVNNSLDLQALNDLIARSASDGWGTEIICLIAIAAFWLAAVAHAVLIGKRIDSNPRIYEQN